MSATTINVPNVTESVSNSLEQIARQEEALRKITDEIVFMETAWESESQRDFTEKFRTMKAEMDKFNESTKEYLRMMRTFVDESAATDLSVSGLFKGISS